MKTVATCLLAFYTILLSGIPCQDETPAFIKNVSQFVATDNNQHHGTEADLCSPLCICACCAGVTLPDLFTPVPVSSTCEWMLKPLFFYHSHLKEDSQPAVWQPPRMA